MKLQIQERLLILNILPKEGNIVTIRLLKDLIGNVGLSGEEIKKWKVQTKENNQVVWDNTQATEKEINLEETAKNLISERLELLNKESKLTIEQLSLYDKFCKK